MYDTHVRPCVQLNWLILSMTTDVVTTFEQCSAAVLRATQHGQNRRIKRQRVQICACLLLSVHKLVHTLHQP